MKNYEMYPYRLVCHEIKNESKESGIPVGKLYSMKMKQVLELLKEKRKGQQC
ncbi:hypothetical protein [Halodesulfovibrio marinisediminis]|uniref:Uncharacterized protein n=1 Tax=Halodesulfovibrio marinisediminis DSM 17456 TaxID=1121457 RepID=A0A1N6IX40_9BACT|nr:hypothetical protein [Halodesulfovibrio marinisediminis]SIO36547.1 hypothetical protein SAMN02745161_3017 [Halodesulfovibrio marinisediminis DSM 17456]